MTTFARTDTSVLGRWWWTVDRLLLVAIGVLIFFGIILSFAASPAVSTRLGLDAFYLVRHHLAMLPPAAVLILAVTLTLVGLRDSAVYFVAPSDLAAKAEPGRRVRLGGLVVEGTLSRDPDGAARFTVPDGAAQVQVRYAAGLLPDLFREGQGVVAEGTWSPGAAFEAERVLAKHDERYMPREVVDALKRSGRWGEGETKPAPAVP